MSACTITIEINGVKVSHKFDLREVNARHLVGRERERLTQLILTHALKMAYRIAKHPRVTHALEQRDGQ